MASPKGTCPGCKLPWAECLCIDEDDTETRLPGAEPQREAGITRFRPAKAGLRRPQPAEQRAAGPAR